MTSKINIFLGFLPIYSLNMRFYILSIVQEGGYFLSLKIKGRSKRFKTNQTGGPLDYHSMNSVAFPPLKGFQRCIKMK